MCVPKNSSAPDRRQARNLSRPEFTTCQTDSIMTLNCELSHSKFSDFSGRLIS